MQGAAPFDDAHDQRVRARPQRQVQAQGGGRGLGQGPFRTEQENRSGLPARACLQPSHLRGSGLGQPAQHRPQSIGQQGLFGGPQALGRGDCLDADHPFGRQALLRQTGQVRDMGWADQQHVSASRDHLTERRQQQAPLGQARLGLQNLAEGLARPAAAWQFGIQERVAAGPDPLRARAQQVPGPDNPSQVRWQAIDRLSRGWTRSRTNGHGVL